MSASVEESIIEEKSLVAREYDIKGTRYIVTATVRDGANQDATAIVRRLIRQDIRGVN